MKRLILMGPPGSGKGTQARFLSKRLGVPAISTGDIFRANVQNETPLGLRVKQHLDEGSFVPDELTNSVVSDRLSQEDATNGFILDGYPRTLDQAAALDQFLAERSCGIDRVLLLHADNNIVVKRLLARATDQGRSDDSEAIIRERLVHFDEQTRPLIEFYGERDLLSPIDAAQDVETVTAMLFAAIESKDPVTGLA